MKKLQELCVTKVDGSIEPFQFAKLRRSLAAAMAACQYDDRYADALAQAVAVHVREWNSAQPLRSEYVFRCVRTVLSETGLEDVARAMLSHRRLRAMRRRRLTILDTRRSNRPGVAWSKGRVAQTLQRKYQVGAETSRILAAEIEGRLIALDYHVVSSGLIAELIRNELMAWGLGEEVRPCGSAVPWQPSEDEEA